MPAEVPLTEAQRAYLRAFEDWLFFPDHPDTARRRAIALDLMLCEADVVPKNAPEATRAIETIGLTIEGELELIASELGVRTK